MKKILRLLLALAICATLATPVMADKDYFESEEIPEGTYDSILIIDSATIKNAVTIKNKGEFGLFSSTTLFIEENGQLNGSNCSITWCGKGSKIVLEEGGMINISFSTKSHADNFETMLKAGDVNFTRTGNIFKAGTSNTGTILSAGNTIIIATVAFVAVAGILILLILNKRKRFSFAGGSENNDKE